MNIFCISTSYAPAIGGAQIATHRIMQHLQGRGHRIQAACFWDHRRTDWLLGTTLLAPLAPKPYIYEGIPVDQLTITIPERLSIAPSVVTYYALKKRAIERIATLLTPKLTTSMPDAEAVYFSRVGREPLGFAALHVARSRRIPFILVPYHHPRWVGWNYRELHRLYRSADAVLTLTAIEREELIKFGVHPDRLFVIRCSADIPEHGNGARFRQAHTIPDESPIILFLGQKYTYKGWDVLLKATAHVWKAHPEARFVFIGPRSRDSSRAFTRMSDSRIIELGSVSQQEKADALDACTLFCLPSSQEAFGMVYIEAWSFGRPVIGLDIPALREIIDDGVDGFRIAAGAVDLLANRIIYLLNHPERAAMMGNAGRTKAGERYTWKQVAIDVEVAITATISRMRNEQSANTAL